MASHACHPSRLTDFGGGVVEVDAVLGVRRDRELLGQCHALAVGVHQEEYDVVTVAGEHEQPVGGGGERHVPFHAGDPTASSRDRDTG